MLSFPNAKINLGLNVVAKRSDGFHDIESCFYPIPWCDVLEILPSTELKFNASGLPIPGSPEDNLCLKAFRLLKDLKSIPDVHIHLHKVIPMGAGLGGGSADGAFTLKMLDELFELKLGEDRLEKLAAELGSDCPFFIRNQPVYAVDTGTTLSPIDVPHLKGRYIALKNPGVHVGTSEAYELVDPQESDHYIPEILTQPAGKWRALLKNDFELSVFTKYPEIEKIKEFLYDKGALFASMTGSGSTVYGLFENDPKLEGFEIFEL